MRRLALSVLLVGCSAYPRAGEVVRPECMWWGYGTQCGVRCTSSPDVVSSVRPHWYGNGYCCSESPGGDGASDHCVCDHGHAVCERYPGDTAPEAPMSTCEFCGRAAPVHAAGEPDGGDRDAR